jgi:hypothetical protein
VSAALKICDDRARRPHTLIATTVPSMPRNQADFIVLTLNARLTPQRFVR